MKIDEHGLKLEVTRDEARQGSWARWFVPDMRVAEDGERAPSHGYAAARWICIGDPGEVDDCGVEDFDDDVIELWPEGLAMLFMRLAWLASRVERRLQGYRRERIRRP